MTPPFRYRLSDREKDALLTEQAALIERQAVRIAELEALLAKPKKTSQNSHTPPSQDRKPGVPGDKNDGKRRKPRPSRPGLTRPLTDVPDETVKRLATACTSRQRPASNGRVRHTRFRERLIGKNHNFPTRRGFGYHFGSSRKKAAHLRRQLYV